jgi:hypothetical protein
VEVAAGAHMAESPRPQGIRHALHALTAADTGLRLLPARPYDALAAVDLEADAAVTLGVLVSIFEKGFAFVRGLDRKNETSVVK